MNKLHTKMYNDLMALVESDDAFFFSDQIMDGLIFRIFNYRLASYNQWLKPNALECRGVTFEIKNERPVRLASWPFEKFFNAYECPFTMNLDFNNIEAIYDKMDGSLISSMMIGDKIWLKSKGSLMSDQAVDATAYLNNNKVLFDFVESFTRIGVTVIMEWTSPDNRIVIPYSEPRLTILALRDSMGNYVDLETIRHGFDEISEYLVQAHTVEDVNAFISDMDNMKGIEGFVLLFKDGQRVKIKTDEYRVLHKIKDSINSQRRLFEACVYDTTDDIRANFYDDPHAIALIDEMDEKVSNIYNHMVKTVESFYETNKHLERKNYAIIGQQELEGFYFGLAMHKYLGRNVDYREAMIKHRKDFGIKDDPNPSTNE